MIKIKRMNSNENVSVKTSKSNSKKIVAIVCVCLMLFSFVACGSEDNNSNVEEDKIVETEKDQKNSEILGKDAFENIIVGQIESMDGSQITLALAEMPLKGQRTEGERPEGVEAGQRPEGAGKGQRIEKENLNYTGEIENYVLSENLSVEGSESEALEQGRIVGIMLNENEEVVKVILL